MIEELKKGFTFIAKKDNKVFYSSRKKGIFPLFDCLQKHKDKLKDSDIADKIVGIGAARLLVHANIKALYTLTITEQALELLEKNHIIIIYDKKTEKILNSKKTDLCPVEKLSKENEDIGDFIGAIRNFLNY